MTLPPKTFKLTAQRIVYRVRPSNDLGVAVLESVQLLKSSLHAEDVPIGHSSYIHDDGNVRISSAILSIVGNTGTRKDICHREASVIDGYPRDRSGSHTGITQPVLEARKIWSTLLKS